MATRQVPWLIAFLLSLGLVLALAPVNWSAPVKSSWWHLIGRPSGLITKQTHGLRSVLDLVRHLRDLAADNDHLEADNIDLRAQLESLVQVEHENELLRAELDFVGSQRDAFTFLPATIISRSPSTYLQTVVVGRGRHDGVLLGSLATSNGFVIGRVIELTETTATIRLITASRSLLPITLTTSRATGLVKGGLTGLTAEDLPNDLEIVPGEGVVTSGLDQEIPAGLPVGTVDHVLTTKTDFIQRAAIHSPITMSKLETVILLNPKTS